MNVEVLLYFILLIIFFFGYIFSALNRKRNINEEYFIKNTKYRYNITPKDTLNLNSYKRFYFYLNIGLSLILFILVLISYAITKGNISNLDLNQLHLITTFTSFLVLTFFSRRLIVGLSIEKYIHRHNNEKKKHLEITDIVFTVTFSSVFIYYLITYFI